MAQAASDRAGIAVVDRMITAGTRTIAWLAFWLAIVLPVSYLPLLALGHVDAASAFILVHILAVLTGQAHAG